MKKYKCSHKMIEWNEYKKSKKRGDGKFPPTLYCEKCVIAKKLKTK